MSYTYKIVYQNLDENLKKQIIEMWLKYGAMPYHEALRRVNEVVLVGFDKNNRVCAVTSVYIVDKTKYEKWYMFRIFIAPDDRGKIKEFKSSKITHEFLSTYECENKPNGIIAIAENKKITDRIMKQEGWNFLNVAPNGQKIYYVEFAKN